MKVFDGGLVVKVIHGDREGSGFLGIWDFITSGGYPLLQAKMVSNVRPRHGCNWHISVMAKKKRTDGQEVTTSAPMGDIPAYL